MRSHIPLPDKASGEIYNTLRSMQQQLDNQSIPTINNRRNLSHLSDGQSAYHQENEMLYLYTKRRGKLFRFAAGEDAPASNGRSSPATVQIDPLTGPEIVSLLIGLTDDAQLPYSALRNTPTAQQIFDLIEDLLPEMVGGGGFITNEIYDSDVAITTAGEWVSLSVPIPEEGDAEFIKVQIRVESETFDWFEVYLPDIRSRSAGTAGTAATSSQRVYIRGVPDLLNPVYFGRDSDDNLLFTIGAFGSDTTAVDPMSLHIREVVSGTAVDEEGVSQNPDWNDIQNKPELYDTTEIFNENVSVPAPLEWVELNVSYPDVADAEWLLVDVDRKDSIRVSIDNVLAKPVGTAGAILTIAQSVCKAGTDLFNLIYFGRTSSNRILFSSGDADSDGMAFNPNPLIIYQIDKQDED